MTETQRSLLNHFHARCLACTLPTEHMYSATEAVGRNYIEYFSIPFGSQHAGDIDKRRFGDQWSLVLQHNSGITVRASPASHRPGEYWPDLGQLTELCDLPSLDECVSHLWMGRIGRSDPTGPKLRSTIPHVEAVLVLGGHLRLGRGCFWVTEKGCRALLSNDVEIPPYVLDGALPEFGIRGAVTDFGVDCQTRSWLWKHAQQFRPKHPPSFPEGPPWLDGLIQQARSQHMTEAARQVQGSSVRWGP